MPGALLAPIALRANRKDTQAEVTTGQAASHDIPRAMVLTVSFVLSPETWLCCLRHRRDAKHRRRLDTCLGVSGPHDFAVRTPRRPSSHTAASTAFQPNARDDRETPLMRDRMARACSYDLPDEQSGIFFARGLDRANQLDVVAENRRYAHASETLKTASRSPRGSAIGGFIVHRAPQRGRAPWPKPIQAGLDEGWRQ